ncbi:TetR family transcriptional regulator [Novosphingobium sp. PP1Y]|uniref:TetR family transcriptional regulator n=1 Tax=Novosphingobium sp. PP1Y TaxID=702113 RepID=UPI00020EEAC8|nr:TetR family transcriptional regulator [Novosphingobium sp. PP1Y]CCA92156.1 TetR family transcriptional regulator [Novosphingobium sp. PP1Y]
MLLPERPPPGYDGAKAWEGMIVKNMAEAATGERRKRDASATRAELIAAATDEFAEKGLAGARVEEIAARTATSKHMIYYHFGSKDGLYRAVLEQAYDEFRIAEGSLDYDDLPALDALSTLVGATFDVHASRPQIVRIIMAENINLGQQIRSIDSFQQRELALETMRRILNRGAEEGTLRRGLDPLQIHLTVAALCFHYIANVHTFGHVFELEAHSPDQMTLRRNEVIATVVSRCAATTEMEDR